MTAFPEKTPQGSISDMYSFLSFEIFPFSHSCTYILKQVDYFSNMQLNSARKGKKHITSAGVSCQNRNQTTIPSVKMTTMK